MVVGCVIGVAVVVGDCVIGDEGVGVRAGCFEIGDMDDCGLLVSLASAKDRRDERSPV